MPGEQDGLNGVKWKVDPNTPRAQRVAKRGSQPASFEGYRDTEHNDSDSEMETMPRRALADRDVPAPTGAAYAPAAVVDRSSQQLGGYDGQQPVPDSVRVFQQELRHEVDRTIVNQALSREAAVKAGTDEAIYQHAVTRVSDLEQGTDATISRHALKRVSDLQQVTDATINHQAEFRVPFLQQGTDRTIEEQMNARQEEIRTYVDDAIKAHLSTRRPEIERSTEALIGESAHRAIEAPEFKSRIAESIAAEVQQAREGSRMPDHAPQIGSVEATIASNMATLPETSSRLPSLSPQHDAAQPLPSIEGRETIMFKHQEQVAPAMNSNTPTDQLAALTAQMKELMSTVQSLTAQNAELTAQLSQSRASTQFEPPLGRIEQPLQPGLQPHEAQSPYASLPHQSGSVATPIPYQETVRSFDPARNAPSLPMSPQGLHQMAEAPLYPSAGAGVREDPSFQRASPQFRQDITHSIPLDLAAVQVPVVPIHATYPVELALRSENTAERNEAKRLGAHEVDPKLPDGQSTIGEKRWFVPAGVDLKGFPGLPQGVRNDIALAARTLPVGAPVTIEPHGWRQGVENGKPFTYQSGETTLNIKDRQDYQKTRPASTVMRSGGLGPNGSKFQRVDLAKGGQDITPVANLVSPREKEAMDSAGLGRVHREASTLAADRAKNTVDRAQNNPQLVQYGKELHPGYAPAIQSYASGRYDQVAPAHYEQARAQRMPSAQSYIPPMQASYGSRTAEGNWMPAQGYSRQDSALPQAPYVQHTAPPLLNQSPRQGLDARQQYGRGR